MIKIHYMPQKSEEWFAIKVGKMSASNANTIRANGAGLKTYIIEILAEMFSSAEKASYTNEDMERGNNLEDEARKFYEALNDCNVEQVGFVEINNFAGVSPDGLISDEGLIEIKCPNDKTFVKLLLDKKVKKDYFDQMQMQMYATNRKWCDYFCYNPNFEQCYFLTRVFRDEKAIEEIKIGIEQGSKQLKEGIEALCINKG